MGVDCYICLAPGTRARDVATVAAILHGESASKEPIHGGGYVAKVQGVRVENCAAVPECVDLCWNTGRLFYHFECARAPGHTLVMPRATAENIAMGRALVKFFGGKLAYNDCAFAGTFDFEAAQPAYIPATDNKSWRQLQDAMLALMPLTEADIAAERQHAAY